MTYNEGLTDRIREIIAQTHQDLEEKKMFGGVCFMVNGKMCVGIQKNQLMVRLDPRLVEEVVEKEGCMPMDMSGKVMKGFVLVEEAAINTRKKLEYWIKLALDYNPFAKASKKRQQ